MGASDDRATKDQRRDPRLPLAETVTVVIREQDIVGPARNLSAQGVYFTTVAAIRVQVRIGSLDRVVEGELVRVDAMGDGGVGIAVRFLPDALPVDDPMG